MSIITFKSIILELLLFLTVPNVNSFLLDGNAFFHTGLDYVNDRTSITTLYSRGTLDLNDQLNNGGKRKAPHWHIWKAIDILENKEIFAFNTTPSDFTYVVRRVISILEYWGETWAGQSDWQGLLNKSTLLHEIEESIIALYFVSQHLNQKSNYNEKFIMIDACCGKGIFSMLASYFFQDDNRLKEIVMFDKAQIKWNHIDNANDRALNDHRCSIKSFRSNLHEIDDMVEFIESLESKVIMVGIHLCKNLSPSYISLSNLLSPSRTSLFILAPCCMPRAVTRLNRMQNKNSKKSVIEIRQYETDEDRVKRKLSKVRRDAALSRRPSRPFHRGDQLVSSLTFESSTPLTPCWKCGELGHRKADCPSTQTSSKPQVIRPLVKEIDVSGVLHSENPFNTYCDLLASCIERPNVHVVETNLVKDETHHQEGNWNAERKSIYIVAC